jgi:hypothetical protein
MYIGTGYPSTSLGVNRLPGPPSGRNDRSSGRNAKYLLVFRQFLDEVLNVGKLALTVPLDRFIARLAYQAGNAVKLVE